MNSAPARHPALTARVVSTGKKISWPALTLAPKTPVTRPRSVTNHRFAMVGPSTLATRPLPRPATSPKKIVSCQISRETVDAIRAPAVSPRLRTVTALIPMAAMSRPEIGPASP
jgi:hypothetical protein